MSAVAMYCYIVAPLFNTSHATILLPPHPLQVFRGRDVALLYSQLKIFFPDVASESVGPAGMQPV